MSEYRVQWAIDIEADNASEAAVQALAIQRDPESTATVFEVQRHEKTTMDFGGVEVVDVGLSAAV